jgi:hypothetical protein
MDTKKGFANDTAIVAIGLIAIVAVAVWVINANAEYYKQAVRAAEATNAVVVQQRDTVIRKLVKQVAARSAELASAKKEASLARVELDTSKKKLDNIKAIVQ